LQLDNHLKGLLKKLGSALHRAMAQSEDVREITSEIRNEGYNLFLVMEANIALEKKDESLFVRGSELQENAEPFSKPSADPISIQLTKFDEDFLSGMQIKVDDDSAES